MIRCKALTINPKRCKMSPMKEKEYCRVHDKVKNSFIPSHTSKRNIACQTDPEIVRRGLSLSFCLILFYFVVYSMLFGYLTFTIISVKS